MGIKTKTLRHQGYALPAPGHSPGNPQVVLPPIEFKTEPINSPSYCRQTKKPLEAANLAQVWGPTPSPTPHRQRRGAVDFCESIFQNLNPSETLRVTTSEME